jgi:hypothetical protein
MAKTHAQFVRSHAAAKRAERAGASSHQAHLNRENPNGGGGIGNRYAHGHSGGQAFHGYNTPRHANAGAQHDIRPSTSRPLGGPRTAAQSAANAKVLADYERHATSHSAPGRVIGKNVSRPPAAHAHAKAKQKDLDGQVNAHVRHTAHGIVNVRAYATPKRHGRYGQYTRPT